jgi:hypothetical protein
LSEKFHVILGDLTQAAKTFHTESGVFNDIVNGPNYPALVDGGDATFNTTLSVVLDELVFLHSNLAAWIADHGDKLQEVRDGYAQVDQSMHELFDDLMPAD